MDTTIQQLEEKLKKLGEEIQELKTKEQEEKGLWLPNMRNGQLYFRIDETYKVTPRYYHDEPEDRIHIEMGNFFKTKELGLKEIEKRKAIQRLKTAWAKDYYFVPDFNLDINKYCIYGWNYRSACVEHSRWHRVDASKYGLIFTSEARMKQFINDNAKDLELVLKNY
jgi:hypothetical protein